MSRLSPAQKRAALDAILAEMDAKSKIIEQPIVEVAIIEQQIIEQPITEVAIIEEPIAVQQQTIAEPIVEVAIIEQQIIEPIIAEPIAVQQTIVEPIAEIKSEVPARIEREFNEIMRVERGVNVDIQLYGYRENERKAILAKRTPIIIKSFEELRPNKIYKYLNKDSKDERSDSDCFLVELKNRKIAWTNNKSILIREEVVNEADDIAISNRYLFFANGIDYDNIQKPTNIDGKYKNYHEVLLSNKPRRLIVDLDVKTEELKALINKSYKIDDGELFTRYQNIAFEHIMAYVKQLI